MLIQPSFVCRLLVFGVVMSFAMEEQAKALNGFDLSNSTVPLAGIMRGGPPRDGIPSIDQPNFVATEEVDYLKPDDIVIGLHVDGVARAYPLRILVWHEIVNDVIGGKPVVITYCPLCGTSMVFDARVDGKPRTFGVSGLLYQSDVLMYDRESESLWTQLGMKAISGPAVNETLDWLPSEHMTWKAWKEQNPNGEVLSTDTGHSRNYRANAYEDYFASDRTMFPVPKRRRDFRNKEWVLGVILNGQAIAYPVEKLPDGVALRDEVGGEFITVQWDAAARHPRVVNATGSVIPSVMVFWCAWQAFYPETLVWKAK